MLRAAPKLYQKVLLVGLGLVLAFLLVETGLRAAVWVRGLVASPPPSESRSRGDAYRVLCLGESTTAPFYGVASYVELLERLLAKREFGVRFRLINGADTRGRAGAALSDSDGPGGCPDTRRGRDDRRCARGVQPVAMQYPPRSLETLRYLLDDADDVFFIDNEAVFREAITRDGYDAVFVDRFAGDFGHCTRRGNELIARHLLDTVFEPLFGR